MCLDEYNLALSLERQGNFSEAEVAYRKVLLLNPMFADAHIGLSRLLMKVFQYDEALRHSKCAISSNPENVDALVSCGLAQEGMGLVDEAIISYKSASNINPNIFEINLNLAISLSSAGKFEEAISYLKIARQLNEKSGIVLRMLVALEKPELIKSYLSEICSLLNSSDITIENRIELNFAAAKAYERIGDLKNSFLFLSDGNDQKWKFLNILDRDILNREIQIKKGEKFLCRVDFNYKATLQVPIFIVGMPRSGTTLLEQMLSQHSMVAGCGELPYVNLYGHDLIFGNEKPTKGKLEKFRNSYLKELNKIAPNSKYVIDKAPGNYRALSLIIKAFPEAKIFHIYRNPKAVVWSLYKNIFAEDKLAFSYNLNALISHYRFYRSQMNRLVKEFKDEIYHVSYEDLVCNSETIIRDVVRKVGIEWEPLILKPELNTRSVKTASNIQIRKPIYSGSSEEWLKWEVFLKDSFKQLDDLLYPDFKNT